MPHVKVASHNTYRRAVEGGVQDTQKEIIDWFKTPRRLRLSVSGLRLSCHLGSALRTKKRSYVPEVIFVGNETRLPY
jgi:hypothetical protein